MRQINVLLIVGVLGCARPPSGIDPNAGVQRFALEGFESCESLEAYLKESALDALEMQFYGGWGYATRGTDVALGAPEADSAEGGGAEGEGEAVGAEESSGGLTGTNVQETGVDEADFVKTDDEFIYVIHGQKLVILRAFPADETDMVSTTDLEGYPSQMFVNGDRAVIFAWEEGETVDKYAYADYWVGWYSSRLRVTVYDITDREAPSVLRTSHIDGDLIGTRMVGNSVRLVTTFSAPIAFEYVEPKIPYPTCYGTAEPAPDETVVKPSEPDEADAGTATDAGKPRRDGASEKEIDDCAEEERDYWAALVEATLLANRELIEALTLEDLLPRVATTVGETESERAISECTSFYRTTIFSGYGLLSVSTIDLESPDEVLDATTVLGNWGTIYASQDQLYLAMPQYLTWDYSEALPEGESLSSTAIHQFDIGSDPRSVGYVASGGVEGWLNNQFSMDEHEGRLRIATTVDRYGSDWTTTRDNTFSVLEPAEDGALVVVGSIEGIAPGEQIMASRIFDDKGYLVTFRQIDPLYAIDLSDPTNPVITGELEIPGFSQYVHPLGDNHLLTVGTAISKDGFWAGSQLSIFDVSDPAAPTLAHQEFLGEGQSEAQYDHKAMTFKDTDDGAGILALPMTDWSSYEGATLLVYDVSATDGFDRRGEVSHADLFSDDDESYCYWRDVRRGILSEDHVYSISTAGYKVNSLDDMEAVASGVFPESDLCGYYYGGAEGGGGVAVEGDKDVGGTSTGSAGTADEKTDTD